jgi:hypothetical protein
MLFISWFSQCGHCILNAHWPVDGNAENRDSKKSKQKNWTMKRNKIYMLVLFMIHSFNIMAQKEMLISESTFKENIAMVDFSIRKLDENFYVRQIQMVNFDDAKVLPAGFGFEGTTFNDNGSMNDAVKGDGVYTSVEKFSINKRFFVHTDARVVSASPNLIFDPKFRYRDKLLAGLYNIKIKIDCEFIKCGCPCETFTCRACESWGWSCISVRKCNITLEW